MTAVLASSRPARLRVRGPRWGPPIWIGCLLLPACLGPQPQASGDSGSARGAGGLLYESQEALVLWRPELDPPRALASLEGVGLDGLSWAPTLDRFAYASNREGPWRLYVGTEDGRHRRLERSRDDFIVDVAWSPDGRYIAYQVDGFEIGADWVMVVSPDGEERRRLTPELGCDSYPSWSPDGRELAVAAMVAQEIQSQHDVIWVERQAELEVIDVETGARRRLTSLGLEVEELAWSPDGAWIAFQAAGELFVVSPQGGAARRLASGLAGHGVPAWSPDSQRIVFLARALDESGEPAQRRDDWVVLTLGAGARRFRGAAHIWGFGWTPDGARVYRVEGQRLLVVDPLTGDEELLVSELDDSSASAWR